MIPPNMFGDLSFCPFAVESDEREDDATLVAETETDLDLSAKKRSASNENVVAKGDEKPEEDKKENSLSFSNTNLEPTTKKDDLPKGDKPAVKDEREDEEDGSASPTAEVASKDSEKGEDNAREEEVKEGGERGLGPNSDTVVVFPEPVSDHEEAASQEELPAATEEEYVLKCVHCTETFTRASLLRDHMRGAHPHLPIKYQCPKCDDTFPLKSHMDKHLALHSPTSQVCNVCNKTFANVYRLQRHKISHDESTDLRKFKCPTCGKAFKFKHHLKEHIRIHSGEKPFECANCGKRFSHSGSYSSHMNSKKCWVLNMKGRRMDRNATTVADTVNGMLFRSVNFSAGGNAPPLQSPPPGAYPGQFLKYDARGPVVQSLYSPPMTTAGFAAAYSMLASAGTALPLPAHHHPSTLNPAPLAPPPLPLACTKIPELSSSSPASNQSQISPDVNFNTQLLNLASGVVSKILKESPPKGKAEEKVEKSKEEKGGKVALVKREVEEEVGQAEVKKEEGDKVGLGKESAVCRHCSKNFDSPIELHQHERYLCKLNKDIVQLIPTTSTANNPASTTTPSIPTNTNTDASCASPGSSQSDLSRHATPNSSMCETGTEDEEEEGGTGGASADNKKYRMRSLISDEQQGILKSRYRENPRPDKTELVRIAVEVGFPKRVVQVWFQNMRARDRRHGKEVPYFPNMARFKMNESSTTGSGVSNSSTTTTTTTTTGSCVPAYIPIVPQIFTSSSLAAGASAKFGGSLRMLSSSSSSNANASSVTDAPLDLSMRRQPPKAHSNSSSPAPASSPISSFSFQDQALNLSIKASPSSVKEEAASEAESDCAKSSEIKDSRLRFQHSSIFKYLQQEGLFKNPLRVPAKEDDSSSRAALQTAAERLHIASTIRSQLLARKALSSVSPPKPNGLVDREKSPVPASSSTPTPISTSSPGPVIKTDVDAVSEETLEKLEGEEESSTVDVPKEAASQDELDLSGESRLVIDEHGCEKEDDDMDNEDEGEESTDDDEDEDEMEEEEGELSAEAITKQQAFLDHHNLETLATVASLEELKYHLEVSNAVAGGGVGGKGKRVRRKSRQMESADFILDLDDAVSTEDEDGPQRKRRRSWKGHKVDSELGMYACDQCDKMFSKQSSLARHKYEHSGARPFTCEVCTKAFKHKHHLTEHRRLHSGEKPFQCKKCGKRFSHSGSYSQHMNHRYKYCKPSDTEDE